MDRRPRLLLIDDDVLQDKLMKQILLRGLNTQGLYQFASSSSVSHPHAFVTKSIDSSMLHQRLDMVFAFRNIRTLHLTFNLMLTRLSTCNQSKHIRGKFLKCRGIAHSLSSGAFDQNVKYTLSHEVLTFDTLNLQPVKAHQRQIFKVSWHCSFPLLRCIRSKCQVHTIT
ncbi:hypothetical protein RHGRI_001391 [Rhododendron griersonianum]|uniref:Response regulatory domain-containing protein n=1 Tax=Rhododendron griersonianum TaxID=479676 RepID=A0AAV6LK24_9ERIC|nr:hypothetical protein RHGRI_001391 [Rhododendron griersonianum]